MSKCAVENGKMYDIKLGTCDMPLDETDQFYKTVIPVNNKKILITISCTGITF